MTQPQTPGEAIARAAQRHADTVAATRKLSQEIADQRQGQDQGQAPTDQETRP